MKNKFKVHVIFWLLFMIFQINSEYAYLTTYLPLHLKTTSLSIFKYAFLSILVFDLSIIPCFYAILAIVDNKVSFLKNFISKIIGIILVVFIFVVVFRISCHSFVYEVLYKVTEDINSFSLFGIFNALMNIGFGVSFAMGIEKFRQQLVLQDELNQLKTEKMATEIKFLKNQINPHFLFNTLNNIYGLALKKSDETPDVILKLSKIMRYNIYESSNEWVSLDKELQNIEDYITIYKLRYKDLDVGLHIEVEDTYIKIAPLILLQFVENAFKYGISETYENAFIHIILKQNKNEIEFVVKNTIQDNLDCDSTKIGLQNIKIQLQLIYPNRHSLKIKQDSKQYCISLKLYANEK